MIAKLGAFGLMLVLPACAAQTATTPARATAPAAASSTPVIPAEATPLVIEYVVVHRSWVERVLSVPPDAASDEAGENAFRRSKAPELTARLADELTTRLRGDVPARAAIADAVQAVLGERAVDDAARPTPHAIARANVDQVRLPAAAKAALVTFARGAHPGDVLPKRADDAETTVVARARVPGSS